MSEMLLKAVDKKNMTVKELWASSAIQYAIMHFGQIRAAITFVFEWGLERGLLLSGT